ncbi:MAG TPA: NAD(P)-binding domain-containing protein [Candidatus Saccharimonadales bacterium]|nr:NAD(P)-binding domain-containing protein [Candidatus Saccharimonadales bacterium]
MENILSQVGIIGAGELGKALGNALTKSHLQVLYYDRDPTRTTTGSIEDLVRICQILLVCVPSWAVNDVAKQLRKAAHPHEPRVVVTCAKGVEPGFVTMDQVLRDKLPEHYDIGVMYGPMIAGEIERSRPSYAVLALSNRKWFSVFYDHFAAANLYLEYSADTHGVALASVLKNVYAIGFGLIDGLGLGLNAKGKMVVLVLAEVKRMLSDMHAQPLTAEGLAGLGDLLATGFSEESFNYRIGKSLAERIADEHIKSEGLVTLHELQKNVDLSRYPVAQAIYKIVFRYADPHVLADVLTGRH